MRIKEMAERVATITSLCVFDIKKFLQFFQIERSSVVIVLPKKALTKSPVFSHPDYTVGCGITPHQLSLTDF